MTQLEVDTAFAVSERTMSRMARPACAAGSTLSAMAVAMGATKPTAVSAIPDATQPARCHRDESFVLATNNSSANTRTTHAPSVTASTQVVFNASVSHMALNSHRKPITERVYPSASQRQRTAALSIKTKETGPNEAATKASATPKFIAAKYLVERPGP